MRPQAPSALKVMRSLAGELFPQWHEHFALVCGKPWGRPSHAEHS